MSTELLLSHTTQASPGGVKSHNTGFSRRSQVHLTGLCPKILLNHTTQVSHGNIYTRYNNWHKFSTWRLNTLKHSTLIHMLRYFMTIPTLNSMNIIQLYILPLPRTSPSLTTLETRLTRPCNTSPRVTDKGGNHPDNPRDLVITSHNSRVFMSLSTSHSVPYILPTVQTNAYLYYNMRSVYSLHLYTISYK